MKASEQVAALEIAEALRHACEQVSVALIAGGAGGHGIPRSCVTTVTAYLERHQGLDELRAFVALLPQLDGCTAQNARAPKAYYQALRRVLDATFERHPQLDARAWLFILSWTARTLRTGAETPVRSQDSARTAARSSAPSSAKSPRRTGQSTGLGAMRDAFERLQGQGPVGESKAINKRAK